MKIFKKYWGEFSVLILSFWAISPLFHSGFFPVHDDTQVVRVYEMAQALRDGQFPVRWVADLGYGFGYPLFNFYAPLPYYVGAIFNLIGLDVLWATKIMFLLGILLSGLFMYLLAKEFFGKLGGILAGLFYVYAPYHALDIYVRGAVGEFWAMAFLPLAIWGFYKVLDEEKWRWVIVGAFALAGVILSHNLTAMIFTPFLALGLLTYFIIRLLIKRKKSYALRRTFYALFLGLGFSAFYWLPALWEMKFTNISSQIGGGADFRDHFVCLGQFWHSPWGFGGSAPGCLADGMSFQIGKLQLILVFIVFLLAIFQWRREKRGSIVTLFTICYLLFAIFMATQYSQFIWEAIPPMAYIQYPWRFLVFITLFASFLAASILIFFRNPIWQIVVFGSLLLTLLFYRAKYFQPQQYLGLGAGDYTTEENIKWKTSKISDEFLPQGFVRPNIPGDVVKEKIFVPEKLGQIKNTKIKSNHYTFDVSGEGVNLILVRVAFFPGWKVYADGREKSIFSGGGQIIFTVPEGEHHVEVIFKNTLIRIIGNTLSALALVILLWGVARERRKIKS